MNDRATGFHVTYGFMVLCVLVLLAELLLSFHVGVRYVVLAVIDFACLFVSFGWLVCLAIHCRDEFAYWQRY